jgi:hypothetical protein
MMPSETENLFQARNGLGALDLGDQAGLVAVLGSGHIAQLACHFHVGGVLGEAHGHVVGLEGHRGLDVFHVLGGQCGSRQAAALLVDALVVGQLATQLDDGVHLFAAHGVHGQHDQAVVEQQHVAGLHIAGQLLVIKAHAVDVAGFGARCVEHKALAGLEHDLALGKLADADLGPCRSAMMATSRPARWAASRTMVARSIWSCALPWLKFRRTTFTPSRTICSSSCGSLEAGPSVATILVARLTCMKCLSRDGM